MSAETPFRGSLQAKAPPSPPGHQLLALLGIPLIPLLIDTGRLPNFWHVTVPPMHASALFSPLNLWAVPSSARQSHASQHGSHGPKHSATANLLNRAMPASMLCLRSLAAPNRAISAAESAPALGAARLGLLSLPPLLLGPLSGSSAGRDAASAVSCTCIQGL